MCGVAACGFAARHRAEVGRGSGAGDGSRREGRWHPREGSGAGARSAGARVGRGECDRVAGEDRASGAGTSCCCSGAIVRGVGSRLGRPARRREPRSAPELSHLFFLFSFSIFAQVQMNSILNPYFALCQIFQNTYPP